MFSYYRLVGWEYESQFQKIRKPRDAVQIDFSILNLSHNFSDLMQQFNQSSFSQEINSDPFWLEHEPRGRSACEKCFSPTCHDASSCVSCGSHAMLFLPTKVWLPTLDVKHCFFYRFEIERRSSSNKCEAFWAIRSSKGLGEGTGTLFIL